MSSDDIAPERDLVPTGDAGRMPGDARPGTSSEESFGARFVQRYALVLRASIVACAAGFCLLAFGKLLEGQSHFFSDVFVEGGKVVVVTSVIGLIFEFLMHERFVERVKQQVAPVGDQVSRLDGSIDRLQRTVAITSGALQSGLSAVYSYRDEALQKIARSLSIAGKGSEVRILGISLGDFLCPHGRLYPDVTQALDRGVNVKALLLDLTCEAAMTRAEREEISEDTPKQRGADWREWYRNTQCYNELKTASDVARRYVTAYTGKEHGDIRMGRFECRAYPLAPLCFLAVTDDRMYLESYHYAGRGGEAPILKIAKSGAVPGGSSRLFEIYSKHFDNVWALAVPIVSLDWKSVAQESAGTE